jgi:DNA-binding NarL/FixJ family response regulator
MGTFWPTSARSVLRPQANGSRVELDTVTGNERCRVLIVDDEDGFVEMLSTVLEQDGRFEVLGRARNGKEALELVFALVPDAVLMDVDMPVMDGVEATERIHRRRPELPVVAVSGIDDAERALEVRLAGAVEYVQKERVSSDLVDAVLSAQNS